MVRYIDRPGAPRWNIRGDCRDKKTRIKWWRRTMDKRGKMRPLQGPFMCRKKLGSIKCPCEGADGRTLSSEEALESIQSQLAKLKVVLPKQPGYRRMNYKIAVQLERLIAATSSSLMLNCWRQRCYNRTSTNAEIAEQEDV